MSPTLTDELRAALREATAPVHAAPELAARIRTAANRRRQRQARTALVLAPVAVIAVVVAAVLTGPLRDGATPPTVTTADQELLTRPTGGDLAGDATVVAGLVAAFTREVRAPAPETRLETPAPGSGPVGEPHVVWAGTTPAGPAAVVVQTERGPAGSVLAVGFVGPGDRGTRLLGVGRHAENYLDLAGAFLGPDRRTVLVLDRDEPLTWSYQHTYRPTGGAVLTDRPVVFTDGVALLRVPAGVDPAQVAVTRPGGPDTERVLPLGNEPEGSEGVRLPWYGAKTAGPGLYPVGAATWPDPTPGRFGDDRTGQLMRTIRDALEARPTDLWLTGSAGDDAWYAFGGLPDGRLLAATDAAVDGDVSRAYVVLVGPGDRTVVIDGGPTDATALVPFRVSLPDGQGRLLAAQGKTFTWTEAGGPRSAANAALVPAGATDVRVNGAPVR
jgi:hypothetical protein